ncbi:DUF3800 domain-containing protein [Halomarina oriensis]|uniref:DUF3800 domain-containing protein n=1 Tax=Halomarina oriensis TaxID=671145 RepID=A0A6B0GUC2_9EURY|nr:hypothetical protein [Halomarina oriensis]
MGQTVYVFIDESGSNSQGQLYTVTGCWCVGNSNPYSVLDDTRENLCDLAESLGASDVSELKGAKLRPTTIDTLVQSVSAFAHEDDSVPSPPYPWPNGVDRPLRFSVKTMNTELMLETLERQGVSKLDAPQTLQMIALTSALDPIYREPRLSYDHIDDIEIYLDADVWKTPGAVVEEISQGSTPVNTSFETKDSRKIPGLQLSDLAAYSVRRNARKGDCNQAYAEIQSSLLSM